MTPRADRLITLALAEDAVKHDVTSRAILPRAHRSRAFIDAKQDLVVCGLALAAEVFRRVDRRLRVRALVRDGACVRRGTDVLRVEGPTASLLAAERTALNFLQRLSGIATQTRRYVEAVRGTGVQIVDTRKTTPGWRALEKYAVRTGGGHNHRMSLRDLVLIKDNHIAAAGSLAAAVKRCRRAAPRGMKIEVEVKTLEEVREAVAARADIILLDNMPPARIRAAVKLITGRATVEVSGGVHFATLRRFALPGVDLISIGALTHSVPAADLSLDLRERLR
ncbi:MAG: nicotinate-nucleotide diphosphorylase (carboxylating) [Opitutus sp.]|nr:nicotinate-nucleotide diphosphorylase (carboxylating) [Opitutus sp.]